MPQSVAAEQRPAVPLATPVQQPAVPVEQRPQPTPAAPEQAPAQAPAPKKDRTQRPSM
ncbi:hypothetical protein [Hymenobacter mucosus]|uniref:hypothetical protein n=1 Tax=Hymenobacter mucosus TaxID=1411120 RepID=UPI0015C63AEE|nr:hypothetical protein [Hymenobacter mucosus]